MSDENKNKKMSEQDNNSLEVSLGSILRAYSFLGKYKWLVVVGNILCFISVASNMAIIGEIKTLIDNSENFSKNIIVAITPLLIYCLINRVCGGAQWLTTLYACNRAIARLRCVFFNALQNLSRDFYDEHKSGWLVARNTGDMKTIGLFINYSIMMLVIFLTSIGFASISIYGIAPILLLPLIVIMPIMIFFTTRFKKKMSLAQRKSRTQGSKIVSDIAENARGIRIVHAFNREQYNLNHFSNLSEEHYSMELDVARLNGFFTPSVDMIGVISLIMVVVFGSHLIDIKYLASSGKVISAGELAATLLYMTSILWPMRIIVELYSMAIQASVATERVFEVIDRVPSVIDKDDAIEIEHIDGEIIFKDVSFRYTEKTPFVLKNLNIKINAGQTIALVGKTGAGKSTITSLLARYYEVNSGEIKIDGINIKDYQQESLRKRMGVVLQQGFLFTGTVMENIKIANPAIANSKVIKLAEELGIHEAINALPNGYETKIHEGGESLSFGQRQLIALIRALVGEPDILILDEPTSSLDVYSERVIQSSFEKVTKNRTTIIIAHRLSTVRHADKILVIGEQGILEQGTHNELLSKDNHYATMLKNLKQGCIC